MRILHVISSVDAVSGGPAEGLRQYCNIYKMGGHEVEVASLDAPEVAKSSAIPAPVIGLGDHVPSFLLRPVKLRPVKVEAED